jgi:tetratricopeptide (TPR) repeat protein
MLTVEGDSLIEIHLFTADDRPEFREILADIAGSLTFLANPMSRGIEALGKKDFAQAAQDFSEVLQADGNVTTALGSRAVAWLALDKKDKALEDVTRWIEIHPSMPAYVMRANLLTELHRPDEAVADMEKAVGLNAAIAAPLWLEFGQEMERRHDIVHARACYQHFLSVATDENQKKAVQEHLAGLGKH